MFLSNRATPKDLRAGSAAAASWYALRLKAHQESARSVVNQQVSFEFGCRYNYQTWETS